MHALVLVAWCLMHALVGAWCLMHALVLVAWCLMHALVLVAWCLMHALALVVVLGVEQPQLRVTITHSPGKVSRPPPSRGSSMHLQ